MYILIVAFRNGSCTYFGPFPTKERADEYGLACAVSIPDTYARHLIKPIVLPFNVVERVMWKENGRAAKL